MDFDVLNEIAEQQMGRRTTHPGREPGYILHHGRRTARLAIELADAHGEPLDLDRDVLYAAGVFHDVGKGVEPHHETGAVLVRHLLADVVRPAELDEMARLVAQHNRRGENNGCALSAQILQDADLLDHIGAQNIWLLLSWSAAHGRSLPDTVEYFSRAESDHASLRHLLNLDAARAAFDRRLKEERRFMERLAHEAEGKL